MLNQSTKKQGHAHRRCDINWRGLTAFAFVFAIMSTDAAAMPEPPDGLMVELLRSPENAVTTELRPTFSWVVNDLRRGAKQTAYQILVAPSEALLANNQADI